MYIDQVVKLEGLLLIQSSGSSEIISHLVFEMSSGEIRFPSNILILI